MKFWDSSALMPLLVREPTSEHMIKVADSDGHFVVWWGTRVECTSAISRLEREGRLDAVQATAILHSLELMAFSWREIEPSDEVRRLAQKLLRRHFLRAGDALQLAAAITAAEDHAGTLEFVCLDDRLTLAALREGFRVSGIDVKEKT